MPTIAASMASWFSVLAALAAERTTNSLSVFLEKHCSSHRKFRVVWLITIRHFYLESVSSGWSISKMRLTRSQCGMPLTSIKFLSTVSWFRVKVPVLSLHRTSIPAISSMAVIRFVIAPWINKTGRWFQLGGDLLEPKKLNVRLRTHSRSIQLYLLRQSVWTDSHSDWQDCRHGDRNSSDKKHEQVIDTLPVFPLLNREHDDDFYH